VKPDSHTTLDILYRDEHVVAVNKPAGLLVHRGKHTGDEPAALQVLRDQLGEFLFTVHRIDRATSGVVVFAFSPGAARELCLQFERREVRKTYWAVVRGIVEAEGRMDHGLRRCKNEEPQAAVTTFCRLATVELPIPAGPHESARYSLVEAHPLTGRYHQIRKHFKHISHPIIGDTVYGDGVHNRLFRQQFGTRRLLLAARTLALRHPVTGADLILDAPLDAELRELLDRLRLP